jgi:hypothetical protein
MSARIAIATIFAGLVLGAGTLRAQDRPPAEVDPKACAPSERVQPGPRGSVTTGENLSDKLARTDGVLCPPNVDPGIRLPTPDTGRTPVIPPPGSPGGDPSVQPK